MTLKQTSTWTLKEMLKNYDRMITEGKTLPENQQREYDEVKTEISIREGVKTHLFSEIDLNLYLPKKELWKQLFNLCEDLGYFPCEMKDGFTVTGPFNIPDEFEGECQIFFNGNHVKKVNFKLTQESWERTYCLWEDGQLHDTSLMPEIMQCV